jgi:hypothetical protein
MKQRTKSTKIFNRPLTEKNQKQNRCIQGDRWQQLRICQRVVVQQRGRVR